MKRTLKSIHEQPKPTPARHSTSYTPPELVSLSVFELVAGHQQGECDRKGRKAVKVGEVDPRIHMQNWELQLPLSLSYTATRIEISREDATAKRETVIELGEIDPRLQMQSWKLQLPLCGPPWLQAWRYSLLSPG